VTRQEARPLRWPLAVPAFVEGGRTRWGGAPAATVKPVHTPLCRRQPLQLRTSFLPDWRKPRVAKAERRPRWAGSALAELEPANRHWASAPELGGLGRGQRRCWCGCPEKPEQLRALGGGAAPGGAAGAVPGRRGARPRALHCIGGQPAELAWQT